MYFGVYREVTTPAPVNPRQNPSFTPTPLSRFVPQVRVVSVFLWVFWHIRGRGWLVMGFGLVQEEGILEGCRGLGDGSEGERERGD